MGGGAEMEWRGMWMGWGRMRGREVKGRERRLREGSDRRGGISMKGSYVQKGANSVGLERMALEQV